MTSKYVKGIVKSTWTPLNHEDSNSKVFEERRSLVNKWFEMWNTNQRKIILEDLLTSCTGHQVEYAKIILSTKAVQNHVDFTRILPRIICLYIFSFLDPRSLCRASQVCWYWKYLAEGNEIWAPKCARLGWYFTGPVNTMEAGLWKKHFIENIFYLQITRPAKDLTALEITKNAEREEALRKARKLKEKQLQAQKVNCTPWRGPDPKPLDIVRNNYIENDFENGARVKFIHRKSIQKIKRPSTNESHSNVKEKSHGPIPQHHEDQSYSPVHRVNKTEIEDIKSLNNGNTEDGYGHVIPARTSGNSHDKSIIAKDPESSKHSSRADLEIPSGRPWILPTDQEDM